MYFKISKLMVVLGFSLIFANCAQKEVTAEVNKDAAAQSTREMHGGVAGKGLDAIETSTSLTAEQKMKFKELHQKMSTETYKIQEETSRLKGVLFETITSTPYRADRVEEIKKQLVKLNDKKLKNMMSALTEVQKIVGYNVSPEHKEIYHTIIFEGMSPTGKY